MHGQIFTWGLETSHFCISLASTHFFKWSSGTGDKASLLELPESDNSGYNYNDYKSK